MNVNNISHIIFDWDGTVMDSANKIVTCMQSAAKLANLPIPSEHEVKHIIGISLVPAIEQLFNVDLHKAKEVSVHYKDIYLEKDATPCPLFDGAKDVLAHLQQNYTLAVATGKARRGLNRAFDSTNTRHFFESSICADEAQSKPSPDMLNQLLEKWQISPQQAIMIGDTVYDLQMAEQIGMPRIGVSYGVHTKGALLEHEPVHIVDDITSLKTIFN